MSYQKVNTPVCCRKRGPLQGPKSGLLSTLRKELSEETHADKARDFIGRRHPDRQQQGRGTQENFSALWLAVLGFMLIGLVSGLPLANHADSVLPVSTRMAQPRWMLARGILGGGRTRSVSFWPFPNSSNWWWLISSMFLTRISCRKTIHANGY